MWDVGIVYFASFSLFCFHSFWHARPTSFFFLGGGGGGNVLLV